MTLVVLVAVVGVSAAALHLMNGAKGGSGHPGGGKSGVSTSPASNAAALTPQAANGFDALNPNGDPQDENNYMAPNVLDGKPAGWATQQYEKTPKFGGLKKGTGLILTMAQPVRVTSITVKFGSMPGANVLIKVGDSNTRSPENVNSMTTIAGANHISGIYTFHPTTAATGKYIVIWFTKLPPLQGKPGWYMGQVFSVSIKGTT
jgi:hypothetical protein